jgi:peptidoglycan/xylan/chitin deacetylase (PgdA/CDA1 family)
MILMYHNVVPIDATAGHDLQGITLRESDFIRQISRLGRIFTFVDFETYIRTWNSTGRQPLKQAVISFDDCTWPTFEYGVKHLISRHIPSIVFVNSCQIDNGPLIWGAYLNALCYDGGYDEVEIDNKIYSLEVVEEQHASKRGLFNVARESSDPQKVVEQWASEYPIRENVLRYYKGFSSEQLRKCGSSAFVEIGAHTHTHPFLSELTKSDQKHELQINTKILEDKTGSEIRYVAYPSGDYNSETLDVMAELGYSYGFSVHQKPQVSAPKYELPRLGIYSPSTLRVLASMAKRVFIQNPFRLEK